jgi:hypothetical protein
MAVRTAGTVRMVRSMQLVLDIDAAKAPPSAPSRSFAPGRLHRRGSPSFRPSSRRSGLRSSQAPSSCRDCGGPLVSGEGQVVCVVCGFTRAA